MSIKKSPDIAECAGKIAARQKRAASAAKRQSRVERVGYNVADFADLFGISTATVHRWISGHIVRATKIGGLTIISASERDRLLREGAPSGRGKQERTPGGRFVKPQSKKRKAIAAQ